MNNSFSEIIDQLNRADKIAVFCHARPDGDALGSGLALCLALENLGKKAVMCCEDEPPARFMFMPEFEKVSTALPNMDYDVFVTVDCADDTRMGCFSKTCKKFKKTTINIDHHISNDGYAKMNYVKVCPATCEIMTELLYTAGYEITPAIANLLMIGLVTDSGMFMHKDVTDTTFKVAALLREKGADVDSIYYNMFARQPKARALLYGRVMNGLRFALEDKLAIIVIHEKDMAELGADKSLTEGFVDFPLTVDGVEVAASLMEYRKNQYKVSLRSKGKVNVNAVATSFGGGGHILASGCMLFGEEEEVVEKITYAVSLNL